MLSCSAPFAFLGPTAPEPRSHGVQPGKESAYAEALEFCRQGLGYMGDEILLNVKSEMEQTVKHIKSEVAEIVENHNESLAAKLDSLSEEASRILGIQGIQPILIPQSVHVNKAKPIDDSSCGGKSRYCRLMINSPRWQSN